MVTPKQVLYQPVDVDDADFAEFGQEKTEEEMDFEKFRDEMRESNEYAKITVYRQPMTGDNQRGAKKLVFLFECGVDEFSFSQICGKLRDEYGSGSYRIQARDEKSKMRMNRAIQIEAPIKETDNRNDGVTPAGEVIDRMAYAMNENTERTERMLSRMMPQTNPMGMLTEMATAMATIMGQFGANNQQPKTLLEQLTEYKMMQELFSGDGGNGGESNLFSLLTETVKSFGPALGMAIATQQESGAIPMTGPVQQMLSPPEKEKPVLSKELEGMRPQIDFFLAQAKQGATAEAVVNAVWPGIPEQSYESIETFLQQENCLDLCAQVNSEVNKWRAWFTQWRDLMLDKFDTFYAEPEPEIIGGEPLTTDGEGEQTSGAVAGDQSDISISATAEPNTDTSDVDEPTAGGGGDAANA
jgi:hypothetical protein